VAFAALVPAVTAQPAPTEWRAPPGTPRPVPAVALPAPPAVLGQTLPVAGQVQPGRDVQPGRPQGPLDRLDRLPDSRSDVSVELPGPERIFRLDTEAALQERIRQENRDKTPPERNVTFPDEIQLTREPYAGRHWPRQYVYVEPNYLIYKRLYFEERNSERYGWDLGPISVVASPLYFFRDVALLPYRAGTDFCRWHETNAGYCLPGDPVPYYLYPIEFSATGSATSTLTLVALLAAFP